MSITLCCKESEWSSLVGGWRTEDWNEGRVGEFVGQHKEERELLDIIDAKNEKNIHYMHPSGAFGEGRGGQIHCCLFAAATAPSPTGTALWQDPFLSQDGIL